MTASCWVNPGPRFLGRVALPNDDAIRTMPLLSRAGLNATQAAFASADPTVAAALEQLRVCLGKLDLPSYSSAAFTSVWADLDARESFAGPVGWFINEEGVDQAVIAFGRASHLMVVPPMALPQPFGTPELVSLLGDVMQHYEVKDAFPTASRLTGYRGDVVAHTQPGEVWSFPAMLARAQVEAPIAGVCGYLIAELAREGDIVNRGDPVLRAVRVTKRRRWS